jgi:hypothetical protein
VRNKPFSDSVDVSLGANRRGLTAFSWLTITVDSCHPSSSFHLVKEIVDDLFVLYTSIAAKDLNIDRAVVKNLDLPSFTWRRS